MFRAPGYKFQTQNGFSLLETVVAIGILSFMMSGVFSLVSLSIRSVSLPSNQVTAVFLAIEAVEYIRNVRDSNILASSGWLSGLSDCQTVDGCIVDVFDNMNPIRACSGTCLKIKFHSSLNQYNYSLVADNTIFTRQVIIAYVPMPGPSDEIKVTVNISWQERGRPRGFTLEEHLFNRGG